MKTNTQTSQNATAAGIEAVCFNSCQKLLEQVGHVKQALLSTYGQAIDGHERIVQSALTEAEALAWQTPYPHLFFPVLAEEKVRAARRWAARQQMVRGSNWSSRVLAA